MARILDTPSLGGWCIRRRHRGSALALSDALGSLDRAGGLRPETTIGLVQLFFGRLAAALQSAAPVRPDVAPLLAERFEEELNASLRSLFGR